MITIEFDSVGLESCSDESVGRLVRKAFTSPYHWNPIKNTMRIKKLRELAKARGGDCLSTVYLGGNAKLEWVCKEGHTWDAVPDRISTGTWCPVCANIQRISKQRLSSLLSDKDWLEVLRSNAESKGGELLSSIYTNAKTRLRWRCKFNHEWLAMPGKVRQGTWCPYCARKQTRVELAESPSSADARKQLDTLKKSCTESAICNQAVLSPGGSIEVLRHR